MIIKIVSEDLFIKKCNDFIKNIKSYCLIKLLIIVYKIYSRLL